MAKHLTRFNPEVVLFPLISSSVPQNVKINLALCSPGTKRTGVCRGLREAELDVCCTISRTVCVNG